jgi:hypothetical protein
VMRGTFAAGAAAVLPAAWPLRLTELGALGGTRTPNLLIRSQMLYPLSYERRACLDSVRRPGSLLAAVGPSPAMICCRVDVYLPEQGDDPEELLARVISPPHFPIRPKQLGNGWPFNAVQPGHHEFEGFSVDAREIPHKGGRTKAVARSATGSATVGPAVMSYGPRVRRPEESAAYRLAGIRARNERAVSR